MITMLVEWDSPDLCCLRCAADVLRLISFLGRVMEGSDGLADVGACSSLFRMKYSSWSVVEGSDVDRGWPAAGLLRPVDPGSSLHHQSLSVKPSHALMRCRTGVWSCTAVLRYLSNVCTAGTACFEGIIGSPLLFRGGLER
jgi:hypothetical protein